MKLTELAQKIVSAFPSLRADNHQMNRDTLDAAAATIGSKAAYTGATTTVGSWMLSSEFGVFAGLLIGVLGLLTNLYFQHRRDKREEREHNHRMAKMADYYGDSND
jgi:hypothetical protein